MAIKPAVIVSNRYWQALKAHYQAPMAVAFKQFKLGAMLFFAGMVAVYGGYHLPSSWGQEFLLLGGIIVVAVGFVLAMLAHVRMVIMRIVRFIQDK